MKRTPCVWSFWCLVALCLTAGCLGVKHSTRVKRENEKVRPVRFESEQAKNLFDAGVKQMQANKESKNLQVSFSWFFWKSQDEKLSDNAVFNDEAMLCDTDGDGLIGVQEAYAYRGRVDEKMQRIEAEALARANQANEAKSLQAKADPPETDKRPKMQNVSTGPVDYSRQ